MYTLYYTLDQLTRLYDHIDRGQHIKIIHILTDDLVNREDRYIVLLDCSPAHYILLQLL